MCQNGLIEGGQVRVHLGGQRWTWTGGHLSTTPCVGKTGLFSTPTNYKKKDIYSHSRATRDRGWWTRVHLVHLSTSMHVHLSNEGTPMTTIQPDTDPEIRVFHQSAGWTLPYLEPGPQTCTTNHTGQPPCTDTAVWKVGELHDLSATVSFWCDTHLPAQHRPTA